MKTKHQSGKRDPESFAIENGGASSSENLDEYIRVSKPGTKIVLAALLIVLAAVIVWGLIGKLPVTETVEGLVVNRDSADLFYADKYNTEIVQEYSGIFSEKKDVIYCFIDASRFNVMQVRDFGEKAAIEMPDHNRLTGTICGLISMPLSAVECEAILFGRDWVTERCVLTDYSWWLIIEPDEDIGDYEFMLATVTIVTEEVAPISFLAGNGG